MSRIAFEHGLVVGKFYPPHEGHLYLIQTALIHCRQVSVLVLGASSERLSMQLRAQWIRECFSELKCGSLDYARDDKRAVIPSERSESVVIPSERSESVVIPSERSESVVIPSERSESRDLHHPRLRVIEQLDDVPIDYQDDEIWGEHVAVMRRGLQRLADDPPVDAVFSSEEYGAELARRFDARHVSLDPARALHLVSSSAVRADLPGHWMQLPAPVRAGLALRVAIVGAESTGTTTLARDLCHALRSRGGVWDRTAWVPEYGRTYSMNLLAVARAQDPDATPQGIEWRESDFTHIAEEQTRLEGVAARNGGPVLVCDTDALATCIWYERYLGHRSASVEAIAAAMPSRALYLLTDHRGVAFEDDGLRDGEHVREWMNERFAQVLRAGRVPWALVSGSREERLATALQQLADAMPAWWPFLD